MNQAARDIQISFHGNYSHYVQLFSKLKFVFEMSHIFTNFISG